VCVVTVFALKFIARGHFAACFVPPKPNPTQPQVPNPAPKAPRCARGSLCSSRMAPHETDHAPAAHTHLTPPLPVVGGWLAALSASFLSLVMHGHGKVRAPPQLQLRLPHHTRPATPAWSEKGCLRGDYEQQARTAMLR
jgi:hypothetical protein